jgi:hypothetical protein
MNTLSHFQHNLVSRDNKKYKISISEIYTKAEIERGGGEKRTRLCF